jgi:hypothetical protein
MVLNAADFLKKGQKKKFIRLKIIAYCLFLKFFSLERGGI